MNNKIHIGVDAPDFTLDHKNLNDPIKKISLNENFNKYFTVLFFIPLAFTPVCTKTFCSVSMEKEWNFFQKNGVSIYGISVDSPFALEAWAKNSNINFPLLSDFNREVAKKYEVLSDNFNGFKNVCWRSVFIINKKGKIIYIWKAPLQNGNEYPDMDQIIDFIKKEL